MTTDQAAERETLRKTIEDAEQREAETRAREERLLADVRAAASSYAHARAESERARAEAMYLRDRAAELDRAAAWHDPNDQPDIETPAGPVRSANEVETCETCEGTGRNCWAHGGEADAWRGGGVIADAVTVDADDLDHTKPNTVDRARRRYEGIDAPAPGVDDRDAGCGKCYDCLAPTWGDFESYMVVCPTCGNKRCPHATNHRHDCTGSNEPGQPGSWYQPVDVDDPLAHVVPGDPDPTTDTNIWCGSKNPLGGARVCHREDGHVGQHIAANGIGVVAVWRDDA